jgi:hypothetical protein
MKTRIAVAGRGWAGALAAQAAALGTCGAALGQNLVSNPGFESPGFSLNPDNFRYLNGGNATLLTGWTFVFDGVNEPSYVYHRSRYPVFAGDYSVNLNDGDSCSTTVATQPGCAYVLSVVMAADDGGPVRFQAGSLDASFNPAVINASAGAGGTTVPTGVSIDGSPWLRISLPFTAMSASTVVTMTDAPQGLPFGGHAIDDVAVVVVSPIVASPLPAGVCRGVGAAFSVGTSGGALTYQWQIEAAPGDWRSLGNDPGPLPGGGFAYAAPLNSASVQIGVIGRSGVFGVRCVVGTPCGNTASDATGLFVDAADMGRAGGLAGSDGVHDNNDFIAFISAFFELDARADLGTAGGLLGFDGVFDNNDFISFINLFFQACG